ncbi:ParM/StbA family protein [Thermoanaerobacterium butyriciformans]|uniref:Plasmid segregation protein ParM n=1 Tax=Thermoanaerobacterium butyriciformans TaxID=1702242 RepID=A0ABS4NAV5_9THEO|nr:ParM/StbA family protein [Thermoanaerobacterium butyriciformans]MBP2070802.1 plasmid segregation protein ParM [Thermoanaerobacterium butyriciformans]
MNIGLDLGYGYVKGVNDKGKKILFPSIVSIGFDRILSGIFNTNENIVDNMYVKIADDGGEKSYYIGELAKREGFSDSFMLDTEKYNQSEAKALLATATALLMTDEDKIINIVTGLPLKQYQTYRKQFEKEIKQYKAIVSFPEYNLTRIVKFDKVIIFPQAAGAVYHALMNNLDKYMIKDSYIVLIDVGFKTTDYVVFLINNRLRFSPDLSGTLDIGISKIFVALDKLYTQKTGSNTDTEGLLSILENNNIYFRGQYIDFTKELNILKNELARLIKKSILNSLKDKYEKVSTMFVAGGGGKDLYPYLKDAHANVELVKDAQFANAYGFLKICQMQQDIA